MEGVAKRYGGVMALDGVDFACRRHSIHAVLGENGAGKSTLIKIMVGVVRPDAGRMILDGRDVSFGAPAEAAERGVVCIFQELSLLPDLTVADNLCITDPPGRWGFIDRRRQRRRAEELLALVGCEDVNPLERPRNLPLSRRQLVELAKALGRRPELLILDEATSALTASDVETVFRILRRLRDDGVAILYISHRLAEIEAIADTCSVFRNGRHIETFAEGSKSHDQIVQMMIGRAISQAYPEKPARGKPLPPVLDVRGLDWQDQLHDITITVGRGEIVGLGGLDGQGQRELLLALFGVLRGVHGDVLLDGRRIRIGSPAAAKSPRLGIALIPEDRKSEGLLPLMAVRDNLTLAALSRLTRHLLIDRARERAKVAEMMDRLNIRAGAIGDAVATLSGGNQQKVVIAKWLITDSRLFLLMDPTRGIDVGTKQELYQLMRRLADEGAALLFYTTDYDELVGMCDRVLILYRGRIIREFSGDAITERNIVAASLNLPGPGEPAPAESAA
jgi:ribose transport system ATP-binding protein